MYCYNCGKAVSDISQFCPYCGAQLVRPAAQPVENRPANNQIPAQGNPYPDIPPVQNPKVKTKRPTIDVRAIRPGLTKKEFINLPELKKEKSWLKWAGIVQIVTGVLNFATLGQMAEQEARGADIKQGIMFFALFLSVYFIATGIAILRSTNMMIVYVVAGLSVVWIFLVLATGGNIGIGILAVIFAVLGARKIDQAWAEYQMVNRM